MIVGVFDRFREPRGEDYYQATYDPYDVVSIDAALEGVHALLAEVRGKSPASLWREQPYLRTVVTFMARNIAQLGLHVYQRDGNDRQRVRDGRLYEALRRPNRDTTGYDLVSGLVSDLALYDRALWLVQPDADDVIVRIPNTWATPAGGDLLGPDRWIVRPTTAGKARVIKAEDVFTFHGWDPSSLAAGTTPVEALRELLFEQLEASKYRLQVWKRGGRASSVITRPAGHTWSPEARDRFRKDWRDKFAGDGPEAGGTPILEDGMTINKIDFNSREQQFIEGSRLALNTVASVYHINPTMIGLLDNANYSNVREFRKMLYGDTLGPVIAQIEDRINTFLVPRLDDRPGVYVEFNIEEKLQGNFEEQTAALSSSVGRPWMTVNEARSLRNMPSLGDGDELVTPLNVVVGGQASPRDSGSQNLNSGSVRLKARPPEEWEDAYESVVLGFFERQSRAVLSAMGAKDRTWWDGKRWDRELAEDLAKLFEATSPEFARQVLKDNQLDPDVYGVEQTLKFLRSVAASRAGMINATTRERLEKAVDDSGTEMTPDSVFAEAKDSRGREIAATLATTIAAWASVEAAKQASSGSARKTWVVGSSNPRASHASMDGETVGIDELFSNGMNWPGDPSGGADEVAGCLCGVDVSVA